LQEETSLRAKPAALWVLPIKKTIALVEQSLPNNIYLDRLDLRFTSGLVVAGGSGICFSFGLHLDQPQKTFNGVPLCLKKKKKKGGPAFALGFNA